MLASINIKNLLKKNKKVIIFAIVAVILFLYGFGAIGNMRYGRWKWNDSSMITELGKKNDNYPEYLSDMYFWSYIYIISPLSNLNYNISENNENNSDLSGLIFETIPDFIRNKIPNFTKITPKLPVISLNVSTEFVRPYIAFGFFGMIYIYIIQILLSIITIYTCAKKNPQMVNLVSSCILYFLVFSFFDNTLTYSITAIIMIIAVCISLNIKIKIKSKNY